MIAAPDRHDAQTPFHDLKLATVPLAGSKSKVAGAIRDEGDQFYGSTSRWVLITSNREFLTHSAIESRVEQGWTRPPRGNVRWTDDYSNLLDALR